MTPCYQLARKILSNPNDKTKITLLFANSTEEDIFLFEELRDLEKTSKGQLKVHFIVSRPTEAWTGYRGRITRKVLEETLPGPAESNIKLFLCGPEGFHKALSGAKPNPVFQGSLSGVLKEMGYTKDQVYKF